MAKPPNEEFIEIIFQEIEDNGKNLELYANEIWCLNCMWSVACDGVDVYRLRLYSDDDAKYDAVFDIREPATTTAIIKLINSHSKHCEFRDI